MWLIYALGCAAPEVRAFVDDHAAAVCARHARCDTLASAGHADEAGCIAALASSNEARGDEGALACPGFDAAAAEACLAAYDGACDEAPDLTICEAVCGE